MKHSMARALAARSPLSLVVDKRDEPRNGKSHRFRTRVGDLLADNRLMIWFSSSLVDPESGAQMSAVFGEFLYFSSP
jgi:hypothetical protein